MNKNNYLHFGIPIFIWKKEEFLLELEKSIKSWKQTYSVTPNPEIILAQDKDEKLKQILVNSNWNLPDWFWLILWSYLEEKKINNIFSLIFYILKFFITKPKPSINNRICWSDIIYDICKLSQKNWFRIFLLWWKWDIPNITKEILEKKFNWIQIVWTSPWFEFTYSKETFEKIINTKPNIIILALWVPRQEYWIYDNLKKFPFINFCIWLWWTFDFICWTQIRAPMILRRIWIEWFWRLILEPKRIKRIFNAVFWYIYFIYQKTKLNNIK